MVDAMDPHTRLRQVVAQGPGKFQQGRWGALLDLRAIEPQQEIILVGDLHARLDNVHAILNHQDALGCSVRRRVEEGAVMVLLGDIVHQDPYFAGHGSEEEIEARLQDMTGSIAIMQEILELKREFPQEVYYILGNHDYLSDRLEKGGVTQGIAHRNALEKEFGREYVSMYETFLRHCPVLLAADGLLAAHGGPAHGLRSLEAVADLDPLDEAYPVLEALQWGRYGRTYSERDVKKFLKAAGQPSAYLVVGHSPAFISYGDFRAELCPRHYVLYSAGDFPGYAVYRDKKLEFVGVTTLGQGDNEQVERAE